MIAALADAGAVLGRDDYLDAARARAEFVWTRMRDADGRLLRTWKDGEARLNAYLEDHAFLVEALLTLYEATFEVALVRRRPRDGRPDDRALRRPRARRLLHHRRRPRGADRAAQGRRRPPDPVRQLVRRLRPAAARRADRRARLRAPHAESVLRLFGRVAEQPPPGGRPPAARARLPHRARPRGRAGGAGRRRRRSTSSPPRSARACARTSSSPAAPRAPSGPS